MCLAVVYDIVTSDARSAIGQLFALSLVTVPEVFAKLNSAPTVPFWFLKWPIKDLPYFPFV